MLTALEGGSRSSSRWFSTKETLLWEKKNSLQQDLKRETKSEHRLLLSPHRTTSRVAPSSLKPPLPQQEGEAKGGRRTDPLLCASLCVPLSPRLGGEGLWDQRQDLLPLRFCPPCTSDGGCSGAVASPSTRSVKTGLMWLEMGSQGDSSKVFCRGWKNARVAHRARSKGSVPEPNQQTQTHAGPSHTVSSPCPPPYPCTVIRLFLLGFSHWGLNPIGLHFSEPKVSNWYRNLRLTSKESQLRPRLDQKAVMRMYNPRTQTAAPRKQCMPSVLGTQAGCTFGQTSEKQVSGTNAVETTVMS